MEYFEGILNHSGDRVVMENCLGMGTVRIDRNECETVSRDDVRSALRKMKYEKTAGTDRTEEESS